MSAVAGDLHFSIDDHEELVLNCPFPTQHLARLDLEVFGMPCQLAEFAAREAVKEGIALERSHLRVLAEQRHGRLAYSSPRAESSCIEKHSLPSTCDVSRVVVSRAPGPRLPLVDLGAQAPWRAPPEGDMRQG